MGRVIVINGNVKKLVNDNIKKIISQYSNYEYISINFQYLDEIYKEVSTVPMFSEGKLIVLDNCNFLEPGKSDLNEIKYNEIINLVNNNNIILIMITYNAIDKRKKIVKSLDCIIDCFDKSINFNNWLKSYFMQHNFQISSDDINYLIYLVGKNMDMLTNEADKLILYSDDQTINRDMINKIVSKQTDESVWNLLDAVYENDKVKMLNIIDDLIEQKININDINVMLANQFRFILKVLYLKSDGMLESEIVKFLGAHPYRVEMAIKQGNSLTKNELHKILHQAYNIEYQIKSGAADPELIYKQWLLNI